MNAKISMFVICVDHMKRSYICYYIICMTIPLRRNDDVCKVLGALHVTTCFNFCLTDVVGHT